MKTFMIFALKTVQKNNIRLIKSKSYELSNM